MRPSIAKERSRSKVTRAISAASCGLVVSRGGVTAKSRNSPDRAAMPRCRFTRETVVEGGTRHRQASRLSSDIRLMDRREHLHAARSSSAPGLAGGNKWGNKPHGFQPISADLDLTETA